MSDSLGVVITADVTQLTAKLAVAKAEMTSFNAVLRDAAAAAAAGGAIDAGLKQQLLQSAENALKAQGSVRALRNELNQATGNLGGFRQLESQVGSLAGSLNAARFAGAGLISALGVDRVLGLATGFADLGEQITKAMAATGMSAEQLSALRVAAQENDVEFESLTRAMTMFARNISMAEEGSKQQKAAFDALGISAADLRSHGNDLGGMLELVAQRLNQYADGGNKSAIETAVFGGRIQGLAPILQDIAENGMAGLERHAGDLGMLLNNETAEGADKAHRTFVDFKIASEALGDELATHLLPALTNVAQELIAVFNAANKGAVQGQLQQELANTAAEVDRLKAAIPNDNIFSRFLDDKMLADDQARIAEIKTQLEALKNESGQNIAIPPAATTPKPDAPALAGAGGAGNSDALAQFRLTVDQMEAAFKGSHEAMLAEAVHMWQGETAAAGLSAGQQREVETSLAAAQKELNSATAAANKQALDKQLADQKAAAAQTATIERDQADTALQVSKIRIDTERQTLDAQVAAGKTTAAQKLQILKDLEEQEYALDLARLDDELSTLDIGTVAWQQSADKIQLLMAQHAQNIAAINALIAANGKKTADDSTKDWKTAADTISRDFDTMLSGVLQGTQTWQQAEKRLLDNLALSALENIAKVGAEWALGEAQKLAATLAAAVGITAADTAQAAAGAAAGAAGDKQTILQDAKVAAANTYKAVSAIPYVGPYLAPEAAAVAFAAVAAFGSFDQGTNYVPNDMVALIHAGERIVPAADNAALINGLNGGGAGDTYNVNVTIQAIDTQTGAQFLKNNARVIAAAMSGEMRNANSSLRRAAG